jgi:hypothetical protein
LFSEINDKLDPLYEGCESNRHKWEEMAAKREEETSKEEEKTPPKAEDSKDEKGVDLPHPPHTHPHSSTVVGATHSQAPASQVSEHI